MKYILLKRFYMSKKGNAAKLIVSMAVIIIISLIFALGLPASKAFGVYDVVPIRELFKYDVDIKGGTYSLLEVSSEVPEDTTKEELLSSSVNVFKDRITALGVYDPKVEVSEDDTVKISLPYFENIDDILDKLTKRCELTFEDSQGNVYLTGEHVESATYATYTDEYGVTQPAVKITFTEEGKKLFTDTTTSLINNYLYIKMDGEVIRSPFINATIDTGIAYISGVTDKQEAVELASLISSGSLSADFKVKETGKIEPTLGSNAQTAVELGGLGLFAGLAVVIVLFFGPAGISALFIMSVFILAVFVTLALMGIMINVFSIAGIILGLAVLAFGIISALKSVRREASIGKSAMSSIRSGIKKSRSSFWKISLGAAVILLTLFFVIPGKVKYILLSGAVGCGEALLVYYLFTMFYVKAVGSVFDGKGILPKEQA